MATIIGKRVQTHRGSQGTPVVVSYLVFNNETAQAVGTIYPDIYTLPRHLRLDPIPLSEVVKLSAVRSPAFRSIIKPSKVSDFFEKFYYVEDGYQEDPSTVLFDPIDDEPIPETIPSST